MDLSFTTSLPKKDFSKPSVPIAAPDMKTDGPSEYNGVPVYYASNMKADVNGENRMGSKLSSFGVITSATNPVVAFVNSVSALIKNRIDTSGKRLIVVGDLPNIRMQGNKKEVVLPLHLGKYIGEQSGTIEFPLAERDNSVPLFRTMKKVTEHMVVDNDTNYIAVAVIFMLLIAVFLIYKK